MTYDLVQLGGEPILSTRDEISMYFRTNRDDGLLFYTGKSPRNAKKSPVGLVLKFLYRKKKIHNNDKLVSADFFEIKKITTRILYALDEIFRRFPSDCK